MSEINTLAAKSWSGTRHLALALVIGFFCLDYFYRMSIGLVVPQLINQYHTDAVGIGAFASAFYLGYVIFQLPGGYLLDGLSLQKTIASFIGICSIAFLSFIYMDNFYIGLGLRFVLGAASALSFIAVLHVARNNYSPAYFGLISGITIAAGTLTGSLIQVYTAYAMRYFNWHICLAASVIISLSIAIAFLMPLLKPIDQKAPEANIKRTPFLPNLKILFAQKGFTLNALIGGLFYLPTSILAAAWGVSLFEFGYHLNRTESAFCITLLFAGWSVGSPIIGFLNETYFNLRTSIAISAILAAIISILMINYPELIQRGVYVIAFLFGLFSSAQVSVWNQFNALCPKQISGLGIAVTNMIITLCATLFHLIEGMMIKHYSAGAVGLSHVSLLKALWIIPALFIVTAILSLFLPKQYHV